MNCFSLIHFAGFMVHPPSNVERLPRPRISLSLLHRGPGITIIYLEWLLEDRVGPVHVLQPMSRGTHRKKVRADLREEVP